MKQFAKILFATDFSESSENAFEYAITLATKFDARLIIVHVINEPVDLRGFYVPHISFEKLEEEIRGSAEKMMEKFCRTKIKGFSNFESHVIAGIPHEEILRRAAGENVSMIVVGTHGRTGLDHVLFGSTAEKIVRKSTCPVMTVRLPESV